MTPRHLDPRLCIRERAHEKLDKLLDMYELGEPLWLITKLSWVGGQHSDEISLVIKESLP